MGVAHTMGLGLLDGPNQQIINNFSLFQKILAQYGFHSENIFWKKKYKKTAIFNLFVSLYVKRSATEKRTYIFCSQYPLTNYPGLHINNK